MLYVHEGFGASKADVRDRLGEKGVPLAAWTIVIELGIKESSKEELLVI